MAVMATKAELREMALARRSALGQSERDAASDAAVGHLTRLVRPGEKVSLFHPIRGEIDPTGLFKTIRAAGGSVLLPVVTDTGIVFRLHDADTPLEAGVFGTSHPPETAPEIDPDLIIAPLAAFDRLGNRIGYGGGYYDRATTKLDRRGHSFRLIGVAFACQQVDAVPAQPHDRRLDAIVTERGAVAFQEQEQE